MKKILLLICLALLHQSVLLSQNKSVEECVQCLEPSGIHNPMGEYSSILGYQTLADGYSAIAGGESARASGVNSIAFGNTVESQAYLAISIGSNILNQSSSGFAIGKFLRNTGYQSVVFGQGYGPDDPMINSINHSMMIGFYSTAPTLFISGSPSTPFNKNLTGKVGIGNITAPEAKLHIKADAGEIAALFIEPNEQGIRDTAKLYLATLNHRIEAIKDEDLSFFSGHNFIFSGGYVGIGTPAPQYNLDVNGAFHSLEIEAESITSNNIRGALIDGESLTGDEMTILNNTTGWVASIENQHSEGKGLLIKAGIYTYSNPIFEVQDKDGNSIFYTMANQGKVGIGTTSPQTKLDVAGTVKMAGFQMPTNANEGYVLTCNSSGTGTWSDPALAFYWQKNATGDLYYSDQGHKVGINTNTPVYSLDVEGSIGLRDNIIGRTDNSPYDALYITGSASPAAALVEIGKGGTKKGIKLVCPDPDGEIQMHFDGAPVISFQKAVVNLGNPTHSIDMNINGKIQATEVEVMLDVWQDKVFDENYPLMDLASLEKYIELNHHLPEVPAEREVLSNGINVGEMDALLLKKIEELTLYVIDLKKENEEIKSQLNN